MFDSGVFTSPFWEWFIIILTVGGILGCFALILWLGGDRPKDEKVKTMGHVWDETLEEYNNPLPRWWLNMFYLTLVFGIIYLILYPGLGSFAGILGWSEVKQYKLEMEAAETRYGPIYAKYAEDSIETLAKDPDAVQLGHRLYMTYCTICHGSDARGMPGFPNLRDDDWLSGSSPEAIEGTIKNGRNGMMPAWQTAIGDEGVKQVTQYVLSLSGRDHDQAAATKGQKTYAGMCIACHGPTGKGNQMFGAPNLTDNIWLYGGSVEQITETVSNGRQGKMPAHGEFLGGDKVHLLASYIYSVSSQNDDTVVVK